MNATHDYFARIDFDLWKDITKVKEMDVKRQSVNSMINEGLSLIRDSKMKEIENEKQKRRSLWSIS